MANSIKMMTPNSNLFVTSLQDKGDQDQQGAPVFDEIKTAEDEETHMIIRWFIALINRNKSN